MLSYDDKLVTATDQSVKLGTDYPCTRPVNTRVQNETIVLTAFEHGYRAILACMTVQHCKCLSYCIIQKHDFSEHFDCNKGDNPRGQKQNSEVIVEIGC